jgi:hypothetical protein
VYEWVGRALIKHKIYNLPFNAKAKTISALHHKRSMHIFKHILFQMATIKWYVCQILDEVSANGVKMSFF